VAGDVFRTYTVEYHEGALHARLERLSGQPDVSSKMLTPLSASSN
jgi:hypothetical protein